MACGKTRNQQMWASANAHRHEKTLHKPSKVYCEASPAPVHNRSEIQPTIITVPEEPKLFKLKCKVKIAEEEVVQAKKKWQYAKAACFLPGISGDYERTFKRREIELGTCLKNAEANLGRLKALVRRRKAFLKRASPTAELGICLEDAEANLGRLKALVRHCKAFLKRISVIARYDFLSEVGQPEDLKQRKSAWESLFYALKGKLMPTAPATRGRKAADGTSAQENGGSMQGTPSIWMDVIGSFYLVLVLDKSG
ncbi:hypothetical protein IE81DRAFT_358708 [Ceraceosorus guamensis]|uniref:Uncharacterized protein n=1 Tax=Ceraceosorus guamensis TaxID=1522189 RepID=A0A316W1S0_9BASI|nr:hypothetical protein IE81DRAFT_358708 [Ceraceosorus guamensis]PWN41615.1 hypothetical protein IE81DRAFT_358708 [Ceraceosorus guamensis]